MPTDSVSLTQRLGGLKAPSEGEKLGRCLSSKMCCVVRAMLLIEAVSSSETSVSVYQYTRCNIPEDSHLYTYFLEKLKFHKNFYFCVLSNFIIQSHRW
jgi:hypothetical protein